MSYHVDTGVIIPYLYPSLEVFKDYLARDVAGQIYLDWFNAIEPKPTEQEVLNARKEYWAWRKKQEIKKEVALRSETVLGVQLTPQLFELFYELYTEILTAAGKNPITEADTPKWWGLAQIRSDAVTLLGQLQSAIDNSAITADQIRDFDVAGWGGWTIARPS
jgi:hypothetical protein